MTQINVLPMIDVAEPTSVEVIFADDGTVWVNVDGVCRFRATRISEVLVTEGGSTRILTAPPEI